jgi:hypothetical protein
MGLGGITGFVGSMAFLRYGNDITTGSLHYATGYIAATAIFGLFMLIGIFVFLTSEKR